MMTLVGALPISARAAEAIKMMIPANPGSGWDTTGRVLGSAMQDAGVASSVSYDNKGGATGAIGLARFVNSTKGDPNALIVMCAVMLDGLEVVLIASLYIGSVMLLVPNLPLVGLWVKLLKIPKSYLTAGILIFATVGVYGMRQSPFDLVLLYIIGLLGVVMRRFSFPTAPVVGGMILGPLAEVQMRNALSIGEGHWSVLVQRPMSFFLLLVVLAVLLLPRLRKKLKSA